MISIIIPIYNSEKTLHRCLDSISTQTFSDWECLLVDDGSRDRSLAICHEYAGRDNRFKVYHKENGGVSSARNIGLDNAKGDFVTFCDSDDSVTPNWLEDFDVLSNKDIVIQGYKYKKATDVEYIDKEFFESSDESLSRKQLLEKLLEYDNFGYLWTRCFRRSLIEEYTLRFNTDYIVREDEDFILHFMTHVKSFKTVSTNNYLYNEPDYLSKYKIVSNSDISCTLDIIIQCLTLGFKVQSPILSSEVTRISNNLVKGFLANRFSYDYVSDTKRKLRSLNVDIDRLSLPFHKCLFYQLFFMFF